MMMETTAGEISVRPGYIFRYRKRGGPDTGYWFEWLNSPLTTASPATTYTQGKRWRKGAHLLHECVHFNKLRGGINYRHGSGKGGSATAVVESSQSVTSIIYQVPTNHCQQPFSPSKPTYTQSTEILFQYIYIWIGNIFCHSECIRIYALQFKLYRRRLAPESDPE